LKEAAVQTLTVIPQSIRNQILLSVDLRIITTSKHVRSARNECSWGDETSTITPTSPIISALRYQKGIQCGVIYSILMGLLPLFLGRYEESFWFFLVGAERNDRSSWFDLRLPSRSNFRVHEVTSFDLGSWPASGLWKGVVSVMWLRKAAMFLRLGMESD
jgi:hypothetical protein